MHVRRWLAMGSAVPALFKNRPVAAEALGPPGWGALEHVESLWARFYPYADRRFLPEFQRATDLMYAAPDPGPARDAAYNALQQRYWEMYLACALIDRGITLVPYRRRRAAGPDIFAEVGSTPTWIECIVPGPGTGVDAVPEFVADGVHDVPDDAVKLRLLAAIAEKRKKFSGYLKNGIVQATHARVIAINGRNVPSASTDFDPPRIARVLYALGNIAVRFNRDTGSWGEPYLTRQPTVAKKSGSTVPSGLFSEKGSADLTGVLYSWLDPWNRVPDGKPDLLYLPNPHATMNLEFGWLTRCGHYSVAANGAVGTITRTDM
jgi:hypothetical protein